MSELRDVPREQAKEEILDAFVERRGPCYPSDVAATLRLDALLVTELCDELEDEGLLRGVPTTCACVEARHPEGETHRGHSDNSRAGGGRDEDTRRHERH